MRIPKDKKGDKDYRQIWRIVDGAILDCLNCHPNYVVRNRRGDLRNSLAKRVTGSIKGYLEQNSSK